MASDRARADSGRAGIVIKLKRTNLKFDNAYYTGTGTGKEVLEYGEPMYFNNEKMLVVGDGTTQVNGLKVFPAIAYAQKAFMTFFTRPANNTSNITQITNEAGNVMYPIEKADWPIITVNPSTDKFYTPGTSAQVTDATKPCYVIKPINGMTADYNPSACLYVSDEDTNNMANVKLQKKAFGRITKGVTEANQIKIYFSKQPDGEFSIKLVGG